MIVSVNITTVLWILAIVFMGLAALAGFISYKKRDRSQSSGSWWSEWFHGLSTDIIGAVLTGVLLTAILYYLEETKHDVDYRRKLLMDLASTINNTAVKAAEEMQVKNLLQNADLLKGRNFEYANLKGAVLNGAKFIKVKMRGIQLQNAHLRNILLKKADLQEARLDGADLHEANLVGATLVDAVLRNANMEQADLSDADLTRADLRNANLTRAKLRRAHLTGAMLEGAIMTGAKLDRARLPNWTKDRPNLGKPGQDMSPFTRPVLNMRVIRQH